MAPARTLAWPLISKALGSTISTSGGAGLASALLGNSSAFSTAAHVGSAVGSTLMHSQLSLVSTLSGRGTSSAAIKALNHMSIHHMRGVGSTAAEGYTAALAKGRRMALWVGGLAGAFGSFVGVGGGVLVAPVISNACKSIPQRVISGSSLAAVVVTGTASGLVFHSHGSADLTAAAVIAATAVLTAPLGARATHWFNCQRLRMMLGYWLLFVAPLVPLKAYLLPSTTAAAEQQPHVPLDNADSEEAAVEEQLGTVQHAISSLFRPLRSSDAGLAATGTIAGFASGLLGIGGGSIVTPALALFTGMPQTQVVGTSLVAMVVPGLVGLLAHARLGNVDWLMAAGLGVGTLIGATAGSSVAVNAPPFVLEVLFGMGMAFLGQKTLAGLAAAPATKIPGKAAAAAIKIP